MSESVEEKSVSKEDVLTSATLALTERVAALTNAVGMFNQRVADMQAELNKKPDDVELGTLRDVMEAKRHRVMKRVLALMVVLSCLSSIIAIGISNHESVRRCQENRAANEKLVRILGTFSNERNHDKIDFAITELQKDKVEC